MVHLTKICHLPLTSIYEIITVGRFLSRNNQLNKNTLKIYSLNNDYASNITGESPVVTELIKHTPEINER